MIRTQIGSLNAINAIMNRHREDGEKTDTQEDKGQKKAYDFV